MSTRLQAPRRTGKAQHRAIGRALYGLMAATVRSQPRDMSLTSLSTLATLELTGLRRITDLAASEGVMQPSMTALVTALERSGLVKRRNDPSDRRVALVALTAEGTEYIRARRQAGVEIFAQLIDALPADEAEALFAATTAITHIQELEDERRNQTKMAPSSVGQERPAHDHGKPRGHGPQSATPRPCARRRRQLRQRKGRRRDRRVRYVLGRLLLGLRRDEAARRPNRCRIRGLDLWCRIG